MLFNIATGRLGDVLLAAPAMRAGDSVIAAPEHRVPFLPVHWLDAGSGGVTAKVAPGRHTTAAWLLSANRDPLRHELLAPVKRDLIVLAPYVEDPGRRWRHWPSLRAALPGAVILDRYAPRLAWMKILARARAVICPNTGTAHMADALGCPRVIGLYHSGARDFLPFWNREHCILSDNLATIGVDAVLERLP